jgi:phosphatidylserine decarboxylase
MGFLADIGLATINGARGRSIPPQKTAGFTRATRLSIVCGLMRWQTLYEARWVFGVVGLITANFFLVWQPIGWVGVLFILYIFWFFRDPERESPADANAVVAAADGVIAEIREMVEPEVLKIPTKRVAIFLSVFDVHTNRAPMDGKVTFSNHTPGKFLDARNPLASELNEYMTWAFEGSRATLVVRQITGAIARRIVGWSKVGDVLKKGERFGMIRFGSRTEVYLPVASEITVKVGDRVKGGETVIARLK